MSQHEALKAMAFFMNETTAPDEKLKTCREGTNEENPILNIPHSDQPDLSVHYEWGKLIEAVVGYPYLRIGGPLPKAVENFHRPSPEMTQLMAMWLENDPKMPFEEFATDLWIKQKEQIDAAIKILLSHGVKVHQTEKFNDAELAFEENIGPTALQQFARDPIVVIGNRFFELPMHMPYRRKERFPIRRTLANRLKLMGAHIVSAPEPYPEPEDANGSFGSSPSIEGGDVFLFGSEIYVGNTGNATNAGGIAWLQKELGSSYRVHELKMSNEYLHLDCGLCTPRPGLAIVCRDAFPYGLPDYIKGWELIEVSKEDAQLKLACNGLVLDDKNIIIGTETPDLAEKLSQAGLTVYTTPFDTITSLGGAFRCWHHPLIRS